MYSINYFNKDEFKESLIEKGTIPLNEKWRKIHLKIELLVIFVTFVMELIILVIGYKKYINISSSTYLIRYLLTPVSINLLLYLIAYLVNRYSTNDKKFENIKNIVVNISFVIQIFVVAVVHQYFSAVYFIFTVPILLSVIYGSIGMAAIITILSIFCIMISAFLIKYDSDLIVNFAFSVDILLIETMIIIFFILAVLIMVYIRKKQEKLISTMIDIQTLKNSINVDRLTGVYTKIMLREFFEDAKEGLFGNEFCIAICDIDNLSNVNNEFSHTAGDRILNIFGNILKRYESNNFVPIRYGGEEFVLGINENIDKAIRELNQIKERFKRECKDEFGKQVSLSIGITIADIDKAPPHILSEADVALRYAKQSGKDKISIYDEKTMKID
ncbi:MAG: GGDEF domain-containing protein [Peptoanaerobacter stomatis]|uniref:GGDEF domain-containing protein n=1 Tax=Peptoanaerobacter stomatis TaxID=796937 RepID=UPI003F9F31B0